MSDILTIGFMIHQIDNEYTAELLKGLIPAANELGINLVILPGQALNGEYYDAVYAAYEYQNNVIYEYCSKDNLDGLIISAGTLNSFVSEKTFKSFVDRYRDIPIITLESKVGDYPCIRYDGSGMYEAVTHLIQVHKLKRIGFVSGPKGNADADSRLSAYLQALEDNGIAPDDSIIAYGNFSEYSMDAVKKILDSENGMPEAICFANDTMCIGGYKVLAEKGLVPGKDILITGYDDSETASALVPSLTTVRSSAANLGYSALKMLCGMINGTCGFSDTVPESRLIIRGSCGCEYGSTAEVTDAAELRKYVFDTVRKRANEVSGTENIKLLDGICCFAAEIAEVCMDFSEEAAAELNVRLSQLLEKGCMNIIGYVNLISIIDCIEAAVKSKCRQGSEAQVQEFIRRIERQIYSYDLHSRIAYDSDLNNTIFMLNNIAKDMTLYADDETDCFYSIFHKLSLMGIKSSRILFYDEPIRHRKNSVWEMPETLSLMGSQENYWIDIPKKNYRKTAWKDVFQSSLAPERPRVSVANIISSNEMQYGIFICEAEPNKYRLIHSIVSQLCTSIRMNLLVKSLESSLTEEKTNNALLSEISMTDELTHIYNRRGFYYYANQVLSNPANKGRHAYLIFADLNNLKKINDFFGHEDGDYAIRNIAEILTDTLASKSIVSRIGGDEFAALTVSDTPDYSENIFNKIKKAAERRNAVSEKPYNVTVSLGIHSFICSEDVSVHDFLELADSALYADKQKKDTDIMKKLNEKPIDERSE